MTSGRKEMLVKCLEDFSPAIVLLSETCLTEDIFDLELIIDGYTILRCDSNSRKTGGVLAYIRSDVTIRNQKNIKIDQRVLVLVHRCYTTQYKLVHNSYI